MKFRNYEKGTKIAKIYEKMLTRQTFSYSTSMKLMFNKPPYIYSDVQSMMNRLLSIVDESDPDTKESQSLHCYQTAESLQQKIISTNFNKITIRSLFNSEWNNSLADRYPTYIYELYSHIDQWDWLPLTGYIHDLGKIMMLPEFGELDQWSVVGDTFPIRSKINPNYPFYEYGLDNKDLIVEDYQNRCGFNNVLFSWGHDEYLAQVLERNNTQLPPESIYLIRYHSFYSWHSPRNGIRGYTHLANNYDWNMLPLLKLFSQSDLYSKKSSERLLQLNELSSKYNRLISKYIPNDRLSW